VRRSTGRRRRTRSLSRRLRFKAIASLSADATSYMRFDPPGKGPNGRKNRFTGNWNRIVKALARQRLLLTPSWRATSRPDIVSRQDSGLLSIKDALRTTQGARPPSGFSGWRKTVSLYEQALRVGRENAEVWFQYGAFDHWLAGNKATKFTTMAYDALRKLDPQMANDFFVRYMLPKK
jgi:hypothetical protein